jgi:2-polyprenyl-6-methoxyphenol hydroxylase-like FAD-dependent oxidoreductase
MYGVAFEDFIYDDQQRIIGAKVKQANKHLQINARLVADCSGIPSVARTKLHNDCKVENFTISSRDMFYVVLRYVTLEHPNTDAVKMTTS